MNGLLAVYKPRGMLSNTVVQRCKRILQQGLKKINPSTNSWRKLKVGHGGTLDKGAEGVLVLGLGRGTKLLEAQLQGSKRYKVQLCLGSRTDTLDLDGDVIATAPWEHITPVDVQANLHHFMGSFEQEAPVYSALKQDGQRLSDLARQGKTVVPKTRLVNVTELTMASCALPEIELDVTVGGGFYVRSLVRDLAWKLGSEATMTRLVRVQQGPFSIQHALEKDKWTFDCLQSALQSCD
eukprot:m.27079 g.27079  ORF g.27079 m.27079 type:complete len:238 (-) comp11748_c0_seq1:81-794(-)